MNGDGFRHNKIKIKKTNQRVLSIIDELNYLSQIQFVHFELSMLQAEVRSIHDKIIACLDAPHSNNEITEILQAKESATLRYNLMRLNATIHYYTEIDLARQYIASNTQKDPFEGSWINKGFLDLLQGQIDRWKQVGLLRHPSQGPIIVVGGGALPQTQIFLYRKLLCEVLAVERDSISADLCRAVLKKAGYGHLSVATCDGADYDYAGAYLVVIATLVEQKRLIAHRVIKTSSDAVLSPRTPVRLHQMWRESVVQTDMEAIGWHLIDRWEPTGSSVAGLTFAQNTAHAQQ